MDFSVTVNLSGIYHRMVDVFLKEKLAVELLAHDVAKHNHVTLLAETARVVDETEMAHFVERQNHRVAFALRDRAGLCECRCRQVPRHIAHQIREPQFLGKTSHAFIEVKEICGVFFFAFHGKRKPPTVTEFLLSTSEPSAQRA